jgi:signal transduction histidine kinase
VSGFVHQFTVFVLLVSVILSFVLRKLIRDIQKLRTEVRADLSAFTERLVRENPTIDNYYELAMFCFRHEMYGKAKYYFDRLLGEGFYFREAKMHIILCELYDGNRENAWRAFKSLNVRLYSDAEIARLKSAFRSRLLPYRWTDTALRFLLLQVPLHSRGSFEASDNSREAVVSRIAASLPTRYIKLRIQEESSIFYGLRALDRNLNRFVLIRVRKDGLSLEQNERFLDYPKILARVYAKSLPQVYDLQTSGLVFYCIELFESVELGDYLSSILEEGNVVRLLRVWLSFLRGLEFLRDNGLGLRSFSVQETGFHEQKGGIYFKGELSEMESGAQQADIIGDEAAKTFFSILHDILLRGGAQDEMKTELASVLELKGRSFVLDEFCQRLRFTLERALFFSRSDALEYIEKLKLVEKIHRASVHGLKGKFSIYKRYQDNQEKLLQTFFRRENIADIQEKLLYLKELRSDFSEKKIHKSFSGFEDFIRLDIEGLISRILCLFAVFSTNVTPSFMDEACDFLAEQYAGFTGMSAVFAAFIGEHELCLHHLVQDFVDKYPESRRIGFVCGRECEELKIRVIERDDFQEKFLRILENLINNSFEALAERVDIRMRVQDEAFLVLEIIDDGPGISSQILEEMDSKPAYALSSGGTGLLTSRNACYSIGGGFKVSSGHDGRGSMISLIFSC